MHKTPQTYKKGKYNNMAQVAEIWPEFGQKISVVIIV